MTRSLRPYQQQAVEAVRSEWNSGTTRTAVVMATGLGKTDVIARLATDHVREGGKVLALAHRDKLLDQIAQRCRMHDPAVSIGYVAAERDQRGRQITVAMAPTLARKARRDRLARPSMVIVDECHHAAARGYMDILSWAGSFEHVPTLGVTATLVRGRDTRGAVRLGDVWQSCAFDRDTVWAIKAGWLVRPRGKCVVLDHLDLEAAKVSRGDYTDHDLGEMIAQDTDQIVKAWQEHAVLPDGSYRKTVAFTPDVASAEQLAAQFADAGVRTGLVLGTTPDRDRERIYRDLESGLLTVMVNVMVATEGWDCLDEETEILTANGWRGIGRVTTGDMVQSLNRDTGLLEVVSATRYVERPLKAGEQMFTATSQHVDIRTSEGHEFHVRSRGSNTFETVTGADLTQRRSPYSLPLAAPSTEPFKGLDLTDDEIRFVAWFMTDGGFSGTKVEISQAKDYRNDIRALLTRLGMDFTERVRQPGRSAYPNAKPLHVFGVPRGTHGGTLSRAGWDGLAQYLNKDVADVLHRMTREQFLVFWEEMLKGDGSDGWLTCDRQSQVDSYTTMAVTRGLSASYRVRTSAHGKRWFRVSVRNKQWITSDPSDARSARLRLSAPRDDERVWCVTNRNSTLITRRNGKIAIIGNCPPVSCVLMARPTRLPGLYAQIVGRGLRLAPRKSDCLVLDVVGVSRRQKLCRLVDLVPTAEQDDSELAPELEAGELDESAEDEPEQGALWQPQVLGYEDVDLFAESRLAWLFTRGGIRFLPARDQFAVLWPDAGGETYSVGHCFTRYRGTWLAQRLPLQQAFDVAETWAVDYDSSLVKRDARWRKRRNHSEKQLEYARRLGVRAPEKLTVGQVSDEISILLASRQLDGIR